MAPELPKFVYDRSKPGRNGKPLGFLIASKTAFTCRQRMETPVIYFCSGAPRTLDVAVDFPGGTVTEWYPTSTAGIQRGMILSGRFISLLGCG